MAVDLQCRNVKINEDITECMCQSAAKGECVTSEEVAGGGKVKKKEKTN